MSRIVLASLVVITVSLTGCGRKPDRSAPKLIVLGVDGMDPNFVERHWSDLPNFARLRSQGQFLHLGTTTPPQSPVAWSTFITGLEPAGHGLFDFVHRDPATLAPFSSMAKSEPPRWMLPLGPYVLPLSASKVTSLRHGETFWQKLAERGIPASIIRMPTNYPPVEAGTAIAGMGTPDLRGTLGTFTLYTNAPDETSHAVSGGQIVKVHLEQGHAALPIEGPPNALRKDEHYTLANLTVDVDPNEPVARFGVSDGTLILREGEWSGWISVDFSLINHLASVRGMFRIFAKQLHPGFELYVSPVNIDPVSPALPVSVPSSFAGTVARETGRFSTLGIPEDTSALRQGAFDLAQFEAQATLVSQEERKLLGYSLRHFRGGLLFFYLSSVDQSSHMLWGRHDADLLKVYREADQELGDIRRAFPSVPLIVLSDHGFTTFDRAVHLNAWLRDRGFLALSSTPGDETNLSSIDWAATEAYAIGLNALYVNRKGREAHGVVSQGEASRALIANLREQLLAWRDPLNGRQVVESVYEEHPTQENAAVAPDLIVGYARSYRASWQTALGGTPASEVEDNRDAWLADHCVNPADVPGVLFTTLPVHNPRPELQDISALILQFYGIASTPNHIQ